MYKILKAETLAAKIHLMVVHAPRVASHCQPGQFIIVKMDEKGERIPLTICDYDRKEGTITIVFQEVGASTIKMSELKAGDSFRDFVGPLGCPSEFVHEDIEELKKKKMVFVDVYTSWCGPCRQEMKNLLPIYDELKGEDLVFISISLDKREKDWRRMLETENLPWIMLWNKEGFSVGDAPNTIQKAYGFYSIPFIVLIDREGRIMGRGLRGEQVKDAIVKARKM